MTDEPRGLYGKYQVTKIDGAPLDGSVFVLRYDRDLAARTALRAYAMATSDLTLRDDLLAELAGYEKPTDEPREIAPCPMPGCGGECLIAHPQYGQTQVVCLLCDYRSKRLNDVNPSRAIAAHNALCADVQRGREAEKIEQERDALRAEVERLREAIARWLDSLGGLYSTNDLRGTDYFDYELKYQMEGEMRAALDAGES